MGIKSDKKIQTKHLKGSRSFFAKEKEKVGLLVGRFEVQGFEISEDEKPEYPAGFILRGCIPGKQPRK